MPPPPEVAAGVVEHPEFDAGPTAHPELDVAEVRRRALSGIGAMVLRSVGQRGLQMIGNILLARWLAPESFGFYAIVSFIVGMAGFLSDLGLAASLIQRRERLTETDLRTAFSLSLVLNIAVVGALWVLAGPLVRAYGIDESHILAMRVLAATILFSTFTSIPAIRLERMLRFKQLSIADLAGQLVYIAIAVPLAFRYRAPAFAERHAAEAVWVFVWATVGSRSINTLLLNVLAPWRPRFGFDVQAMWRMLRFGLPFHLNGLVNALKDNFIPTFIALVVGARAVGYVTWAAGMATNALLFLPVVSKVTFPTYARLQHDRPALKQAVEHSIKWVAATVFPTTLLLAALGRQIVEHVYGPKWFPGLPSFYLLCIPMLNAAYSTVMVSALYGIGRAKVVLRLTVTWALAGWALGVPLTFLIGQNGFALAMSIVSWMSIMSVREMNKVVKIEFVPTLLRILVIAAIPAAIVAAVARFLVHDVVSLAGLALAGGAAYVGLMWWLGELDELLEMIARRRRRPAVVAPEAPAVDTGAVAEHA